MSIISNKVHPLLVRALKSIVNMRLFDWFLNIVPTLVPWKNAACLMSDVSKRCILKHPFFRNGQEKLESRIFFPPNPNFYLEWKAKSSRTTFLIGRNILYPIGWYQKRRRKTRREQRLITERDLPSTTMLLPCSSLGTLD